MKSVKNAGRSRTKTAPKNNPVIENSLQEAVFGGPNAQWTTQLSQVNTVFKNNRWYLISNMRQVLNEIYVEHGLIQTIIDVPVDDGLRGGVEIKSKQLSPEQIEALVAKMEREDDLGNMAQALKWNRLFGGAGILVITDQDPSTPLSVEDVNEESPLEFRAVDMWELFYDKQNVEGFNMEVQETQFEFYNYYAKKVHKSRVMKFKGLTAPSFIRPRLRGWGVSVIEPFIRSLNQYLKATDLIFEVLDEFKVDAYKIKNLANTLLTNNGTETVRKRIALANQQKNYQHAIVMDSEDDFIQKELSFAGIAEVMEQIRMQIACELRMPLSKIFGISATGFSSGEDDIENYNAMVESQVRQKCKYQIVTMIEIRCQQLFGMIPSDLTIDFKPLRILSSEQEENVKTQQFARTSQAKAQGEISSLEFRNACNKDGLLPIQLDTEGISDEITGLGETEEDSANISAPKGKKSATAPKDAKA